MAETLLVLQAVSAAIAVGMNAAEAVDRISALVRDAHARGATLSADDLATLFDQGDQLEAEVRARFLAAKDA